MKRPLLLTLDAFETLFHPRHPVPTQYASTAASYNIPISPSRLQPAFKAAFKAHSLSHPNYGRDRVLRGEYAGPRQWWEEVIRGSFARALASEAAQHPRQPQSEREVELPAAMIEDLLDRFASARGYTLYEDVGPFFEKLRGFRGRPGGRTVVVGVVSNSDDRISAVLESLGVSVGDARGGEEDGGRTEGRKLPGFEEVREEHRTESASAPLRQADVDFVVTSYQAGAEKPERLIWDVARRRAMGGAGAGADAGDWECVHVGDDYNKDYCGALDAGWKAYFLPRDGEAGNEVPEGTRVITSLLDLMTELDIE